MNDNGINPDSASADELANKMIEWAVNADDSGNSYIHSLKIICSAEYTQRKNLGILASLPVAYDREMAYQAKKAAEEAARKAQPESQYVGEVGKRIEISVKEMKITTSWETDWGIKWLYRIVDTDGNILIWKTTGGPATTSNITAIKATVKAHNEYKGTKQTELTRCEIIKVA